MFQQDSLLVTILNKIADMVILSFLWCVFSLPIITIGASTAALYHCVIKVIRQDRGYVFSGFFSSFKENFKSSLGPTLFFIIAFAVCATGCYLFWNDTESIFASSYVILSMLLILLLAVAFLHTFALIGRFNLNKSELFTVALRLTTRHIFRNILMLCLLIFASELTLQYIPLLFFIIPSGLAFLNSLIQEPLFTRYIRFEDDWNTDILHQEDLPFRKKKDPEQVPDSQENQEKETQN